jgi:hypothetical protein
LPDHFHISEEQLTYVDRELSKRKLNHKEINYKASLSWTLMDVLNNLSQEYFDKSVGTTILLRQSNYNSIQELILYLEANYAQKITAQDLEQQEAAKASIMMDVDANVWYEGQQVAVSEIESLLKPFTEKDREYLVHVSIHKDLLRKDYQPLIEAVSAAGVKLILTGEKED